MMNRQFLSAAVAVACLAQGLVPLHASASSTRPLFLSDRAVVAQASQSCNQNGRPVAAGSTWCRAGELHECNGRTGEWVNLRKRC